MNAVNKPMCKCGWRFACIRSSQSFGATFRKKSSPSLFPVHGIHSRGCYAGHQLATFRRSWSWCGHDHVIASLLRIWTLKMLIYLFQMGFFLGFLGFILVVKWALSLGAYKRFYHLLMEGMSLCSGHTLHWLIIDLKDPARPLLLIAVDTVVHHAICLNPSCGIIETLAQMCGCFMLVDHSWAGH